MKIIVFSKSDYTFSAKLSKICDLYSDELVFFDKFESLKEIESKTDALVIIDYNDYNDSLKDAIILIKNRSQYSSCILIDKMESKIQKKVTDIGFDIIMTKQLFLMNIKTIKSQILKNEFKA